MKSPKVYVRFSKSYCSYMMICLWKFLMTGQRWWLINFVPTPCFLSFFGDSTSANTYLHIDPTYGSTSQYDECPGKILAIIGASSQVPSPTHVSKSQYGSKIPTFEPQVTTKIWLNIIQVRSWLYYAQIFMGLRLSVGSSFWLDSTCNTSPKPHLQRCCHVGIHDIIET